MAPHSSTVARKIPWTEEPGGLQSMGLLRVRHNWLTSFSLSAFMHWRRKWQPTPVFLPGESHGRRSLVGCSPWGRTESDTTEATWQQAAHTSKVMLKILQARLQQYVNGGLPEVQTKFREGRGTRNQIVNTRWIIEKAREFHKKTSTFALGTTLRLLTVWITTNCGNS